MKLHHNLTLNHPAKEEHHKSNGLLVFVHLQYLTAYTLKHLVPYSNPIAFLHGLESGDVSAPIARETKWYLKPLYDTMRTHAYSVRAMELYSDSIHSFFQIIANVGHTDKHPTKYSMELFETF